MLPLMLVIFMAGCDNTDDPEDENEEEVITTMRLRFVDNANTSTAVTYSFEDPDGEGGNAPTVIDDIVLDANATYTVGITVANESDPNNVEDITEEILEENNEHLFCFTPSGDELSVDYADSDGTFPVGLTSTWTTTSASNGTVTVVLKHQPGVKDGTCSPGETDIEVTFNYTIQ